MDIIKDLLYIATFPKLSGVLEMFKLETEDSDYLELKSKLETLTIHSRLPEIEHFVIGTEKKALDEIIRQTEGWFLLFEYNGVSVNQPDKMQIRGTNILYTITIGHHSNQRNTDIFKETIIANKGLQLMFDLIRLIKADDGETCASKRWLNNAFEINEIEPQFLMQSTGWELIIHKDLNTSI